LNISSGRLNNAVYDAQPQPARSVAGDVRCKQPFEQNIRNARPLDGPNYYNRTIMLKCRDAKNSSIGHFPHAVQKQINKYTYPGPG
jgi:hypothetical protein